MTDELLSALPDDTDTGGLDELDDALLHSLGAHTRDQLRDSSDAD